MRFWQTPKSQIHKGKQDNLVIRKNAMINKTNLTWAQMAKNHQYIRSNEAKSDYQNQNAHKNINTYDKIQKQEPRKTIMWKPQSQGTKGNKQETTQQSRCNLCSKSERNPHKISDSQINCEDLCIKRCQISMGVVDKVKNGKS